MARSEENRQVAQTIGRGEREPQRYAVSVGDVYAEFLRQPRRPESAAKTKARLGTGES